jgi:ketosteroid isomerase-like protein
MGAVEEFVDHVVPKLEAEASAIHAGDVEPRMALWSRRNPVTLFGAVMTRSGWDELEPAFVRLAESFCRSESFRLEVLAAGVSGDLGYVVGIERSRAARTGGDVVEYALRVTTILRREAGDWRVVHRHGDRYDEASRTVMP